MNLQEQNFEDLKREFYTNRTGPKASRLVRELKKSELSWLLRHHREERIKNKETWQRDYFDYLLAYYSILEIALLIGFVSQIPLEDQNQALEHLNHAAIRKYYEENYPLELPGRLRRRLSGRGGLRIKDQDGKLTALFLEFTALTAYFETDPDLETFLWFLEGGVRNGYWYKDLLRVLASLDLLVESITKTPEAKTELDESVEGFGKFLEFCVQLDAILASSEFAAPFQIELFHYYAYWFQRLRKRIGSQISIALSNYVEVDAERGHGFVDRARAAIERLLSGVYAGNSNGTVG